MFELGQEVGVRTAVDVLNARQLLFSAKRDLLRLAQERFPGADARLDWWLDATTSTSFACDLKKWLQIMETFEGGGHAYHATMPTDAIGRAVSRS